ncbi:ATPase (plasmid) [Microcystis aeruginosa NIES-2481]|uniref:AAA family ATPase n=1 Tax=Microcystis aeruginosa TaxID=1126 RepID=UPI000CA22C51|nr:AAA family ATPase [Microcystis aeruginosa]AUS35866.1 ATPase [Microcystis aeruginosa NIES-2481]
MNNTKNKLISYIDALRPIIYINHFDFSAVDDLIGQVVDQDKIYEYNDAFGAVDFKWKNPKDYSYKQDLLQFLTDFYDIEEENYLILKDVHFHLENPQVIATIKAIALKRSHPEQENFETTIFIVSSKLVIPLELEHLITVFDFPLLSKEEIILIINKFIEDFNAKSIDKKIVEELALSCKGLSEFEINQILYLAYQNDGEINLNDKEVIIKEKEQIIKKSGILEILNFKENIDDIGGLENLKKWLKKKAKIFKDLDKAIEYGVDTPKGIMLVGMPGCGKSLVAKATARLFEVPLLRLDIGKLLGKYVGESEENLRKAIKIAEAVSPCILWIDEIEKAFAGVGEVGGGGDVTTRLFGNFLTWLQEKENTVFVVATANDISKFPPEFLRKGRFDELFSVSFPNEEERKNIFEIHLRKRHKLNNNIDLNILAKKTDKFSGADIEAVVKESVENSFFDDKKIIETNDVMTVITTTQPLSKSFEDKISIIEEYLKTISFKSAS